MTVPDPSHRFREVALRIVDADGSPLPPTAATVEQTRHAFGFGNIGFDLPELLGGPPSGADGDAARVFGGAEARRAGPLLDAWLGLFDTVTLPFYWRGFEPQPGRPDTSRLLTTARWFAERGIRVKGHPLV